MLFANKHRTAPHTVLVDFNHSDVPEGPTKHVKTAITWRWQAV